jgi:hypothetical protein
VTSIDSVAARTLPAGASRARRQGRRVVAINARPEVQQKLGPTGIARELKLVDTPPITGRISGGTPENACAAFRVGHRSQPRGGARPSLSVLGNKP